VKPYQSLYTVEARSKYGQGTNLIAMRIGLGGGLEIYTSREPASAACAHANEQQKARGRKPCYCVVKYTLKG
jgi:hypothetical protein